MLINASVSIILLSLLAFLLLRCLADWGLPLRSLPAWGAGRDRQDGAILENRESHEPPKSQNLRVFLFALALRLAVLLAFAAAVFLASSTGVTWEAFLSKFQLWDARHYLNLIEQGYAGYEEQGQHIFLVFFPAYVWVCRLFSLVMPPLAAGLLVSVLSFSWGCCYVYRLGRELYGEATAWYGVLLLCAFPYSFFYGAVMTEGLFLLSTAAACYYALKGKWLAYGLWGVLAAATRMTGVLVLVFAGVELLRSLKPLEPPAGQSLKRAWKPLLLRLPLILLPLLGTASYLLLNWHVDGDPFAFAGHQEHWHQGSMWVSKVVEYLIHYAKNYASQSVGWAIWLPSLVLFAGFLSVLWLSALRRENRPSLLLFSLGYFTANYSLSWLLSAGRYLSGGFPLFLLLAALAQRHPRLRDLLLLTECLFLGIYLYAYANNAQIM